MLDYRTQTLYFAPFLSFAVQIKRNTAAFRFSSATCFEVFFRPIAKEARVGLLAFRMLIEGAARFTINISQFSLIFPSTSQIKHEKVTLCIYIVRSVLAAIFWLTSRVYFEPILVENWSWARDKRKELFLSSSFFIHISAENIFCSKRLYNGGHRYT